MGKHEMHDRCFSSSVWCNVCKRKLKGKGKQVLSTLLLVWVVSLVVSLVVSCRVASMVVGISQGGEPSIVPTYLP
jgi:hypothetical protein